MMMSTVIFYCLFSDYLPDEFEIREWKTLWNWEDSHIHTHTHTRVQMLIYHICRYQLNTYHETDDAVQQFKLISMGLDGMRNVEGETLHPSIW